MVKNSKISSNKLFRSSTKKIIAGVAGGIGEYFDIDPLFIRIIFILLFLYSGSGILIYLLLWLIIPKKSSSAQEIDDTVKSNFIEMKSSAKEFITELKSKHKVHNSRFILGIFLLILGFAFLLDNFGIIVFDHIWKFWPLVIVAIGFIILFKNGRKSS